MIKRYDTLFRHTDMVENNSGEWVKYSEVEAELTALRSRCAVMKSRDPGCVEAVIEALERSKPWMEILEKGWNGNNSKTKLIEDCNFLRAALKSAEVKG